MGDLAQLPAVVKSIYARAMGADISIMERVMDYFARDPSLHVTLTTQYRMHPILAAFPSFWSYESTLLSGVRARDRPPPRGVDWPKVLDLGAITAVTRDTAPDPPSGPDDPNAAQVDFLAAHPGAFPPDPVPAAPRAVPAVLPGLPSPDVTVVGTAIPLLLVHVDGCEGRVGSSYVNHAEAHALTRFLHQLGPAWAEDGLSIGVPLLPTKARSSSFGKA